MYSKAVKERGYGVKKREPSKIKRLMQQGKMSKESGAK